MLQETNVTAGVIIRIVEDQICVNCTMSHLQLLNKPQRFAAFHLRLFNIQNSFPIKTVVAMKLPFQLDLQTQLGKSLTKAEKCNEP